MLCGGDSCAAVHPSSSSANSEHLPPTRASLSRQHPSRTDATMESILSTRCMPTRQYPRAPTRAHGWHFCLLLAFAPLYIPTERPLEVCALPLSSLPIGSAEGAHPNGLRGSCTIIGRVLMACGGGGRDGHAAVEPANIHPAICSRKPQRKLGALGPEERRHRTPVR